MKNAALLLLFFGALPASAQMTIQPLTSTSYRGQGDVQGNQWGTLTISLRSPLPPAVLGAPFSGKEERKSEQLLADGTRITQPIQSGAIVARDALGRTRLERSLMPVMTTVPGRPARNPMMIVEINDPVDAFYYVIDPAKKIAYRIKYTPVPGRPVPTTRPRMPSGPQPPLPGAAPGTGPQISVESLGTKYMQGVQAEGTRQTVVFPVGARGNDRPLTDVNETWTVPSLQLPILQTSISATGNSSFELTNFSNLNPAPDQFRPPPGYEVRDQPASFTVEFGNRPEGATPTSSFSGGGVSAPGPQR